MSKRISDESKYFRTDYSLDQIRLYNLFKEHTWAAFFSIPVIYFVLSITNHAFEAPQQIWTVLSIVALAARMIFANLYLRGEKQGKRSTEILYAIIISFQGVLWGVAPIFFADKSLEGSLIIVLVPPSLIVGFVVNSMPSLIINIFYILGTSLAYCVYAITCIEEHRVALIVAITLFSLFVLKVSKNGYKSFVAIYNLLKEKQEFLKEISGKLDLENDLKIERQKNFQQAKLVSIGEMASGIGHEINNPLTIIFANTSKLQTLVKRDKVDKEDFFNITTKINEAVLRISNIIKGLRELGRDATSDEKQEESLCTILENVQAITCGRFKQQGISLELCCEDDLRINCRKVQLEQVLINMLNNSYDSICAKGVTEKSYTKITLLQEDDYAALYIEDNGEGIADDIYDKIMDPFFTTREVSKGTGLGLSTSKSIIEEHEGGLYNVSKRAPTIFLIKIPLALKSSVKMVI